MRKYFAEQFGLWWYNLQKMYCIAFNLCFICRKDIDASKTTKKNKSYAGHATIAEYTIHCGECDHEIDLWHFGNLESEYRHSKYKLENPKTLVFLESLKKYKTKLKSFF